MKTKRIFGAILACAVGVVGCDRKAVPLSTAMTVSTNTVLPWLTDEQVKESLQRPQATTQIEVTVHEPTFIDPQELERDRIQRMTLINERKKEQ